MDGVYYTLLLLELRRNSSDTILLQEAITADTYNTVRIHLCEYCIILYYIGSRTVPRYYHINVTAFAVVTARIIVIASRVRIIVMHGVDIL